MTAQEYRIVDILHHDKNIGCRPPCFAHAQRTQPVWWCWSVDRSGCVAGAEFSAQLCCIFVHLNAAPVERAAGLENPLGRASGCSDAVRGGEEACKIVIFKSKNLDFLSKNLHFLLKNNQI